MAKSIDSLVNLDEENESRIWLEELKDAIDSVVPVYDETITTTAQTVDITGLDGLKYGGYHIELSLYQEQGSGVGYSMYINGDTTATNYYNTEVVDGGAGATSNDGEIGSSTATRETTYIIIDLSMISNTFEDGYIPRAIVHENRKARNSVQIVSRSWITKNVQSELTSIRISADKANGIGVGSTIRIWRKV